MFKLGWSIAQTISTICRDGHESLWANRARRGQVFESRHMSKVLNTLIHPHFFCAYLGTCREFAERTSFDLVFVTSCEIPILTDFSSPLPGISLVRARKIRTIWKIWRCRQCGREWLVSWWCAVASAAPWWCCLNSWSLGDSSWCFLDTAFLTISKHWPQGRLEVTKQWMLVCN